MVVAIIKLPFLNIFVLDFLTVLGNGVLTNGGDEAGVSESTEFCVYNFFFLVDFTACKWGKILNF